MMNHLLSLIIILLYFTCINSFAFKSSHSFILKQKQNKKMKLHFQAIDIIKSGLSVTFVVAFHEFGHYILAKLQGMKIQSFNVGYGPKVFAINNSNNSTEFALRLVPLGGYVAFPMNVVYNDEGEIVKELSDPDLIQNRPAIQRLVVISGGILANFLLTFLLSTSVALTTGLNQPTYGKGIVVSSILSSSPGQQADLRIRDIITSVDGNNIGSTASSNEEFVRFIRNHPEMPVKLEILRNAQVLQKEVIPRSNGVSNKGSIGIGISSNILDIQTRKADNLIEGMNLGYQETRKMTIQTVNGLKNFATNGLTAGNELGGPISVMKTGAELSQVSSTALLGFMAALSVNLAVLNALPLPALDGGQFVFAFSELITRKKLPRKFQENITSIAFTLLFILSISTFVSDIENLNRNK